MRSSWWNDKNRPLFNFPSLSLRRRVKGRAGVGNGPRHNLADAHRPMAAGARRLKVASLAFEIPVGWREWRAHSRTLGGIGGRRADGRLRNAESSQRCRRTS